MSLESSTNNISFCGCGRKYPDPLLVQPLWKSRWRVLRLLNSDLPFVPTTPLVGIYPNDMKSVYEKNNLKPCIYSSRIYLRKDREMKQLSINRELDKETLRNITQPEKWKILPSATTVPTGDHYAQ